MTILAQVSSDAALYKVAIGAMATVIVVLSGVISFLFLALQRAKDQFLKAQETRLLAAEDYEKAMSHLKDIIVKLKRRGKLQ